MISYPFTEKFEQFVQAHFSVDIVDHVASGDTHDGYSMYLYEQGADTSESSEADPIFLVHITSSSKVINRLSGESVKLQKGLITARKVINAYLKEQSVEQSVEQLQEEPKRSVNPEAIKGLSDAQKWDFVATFDHGLQEVEECEAELFGHMGSGFHIMSVIQYCVGEDRKHGSYHTLCRNLEDNLIYWAGVSRLDPDLMNVYAMSRKNARVNVKRMQAEHPEREYRILTVKELLREQHDMYVSGVRAFCEIIEHVSFTR